MPNGQTALQSDNEQSDPQNHIFSAKFRQHHNQCSMPDQAMHDRETDIWMDDRQSDPYVSMWRFASLAQLKHTTAEQSDRHG